MQILVGRKYIIENPAFSDIFHSDESPLKALREHLLAYYLALLDQCACGGKVEGQFVKKPTHFQSSHEMHHLCVRCSGGHTHLHLRGGGRAAMSAKYPKGECNRIMQDGVLSPTASEGGRIPPSRLPEGFSKLSMTAKMSFLKSLVSSLGLSEAWNNIVARWWTPSESNCAKIAVASETSDEIIVAKPAVSIGGGRGSFKNVEGDVLSPSHLLPD